MYYIGLDLGQRRDSSAIAVVERVEGEGSFDPVSWRYLKKSRERRMVVRYLERIRLGTAYTDVVGRVGQVVRSPLISGPRRVVVDATGVVAPVLLTGGDAERNDGRVRAMKSGRRRLGADAAGSHIDGMGGLFEDAGR